MPEDVTRSNLPMPPAWNGEACLVLLYGHGELGKRHTLSESMTLGRGSDNDLSLDLEDVSRQHARLTPEEEGWAVEDMGSTNGTLVNGAIIQERTLLRNGDLLKVGRAIFKYIEGGNIEALFHEEIYQLTVTDGLTKIPNKRYLMDFLDRELARASRYGSPLTAVMMDIDHFKGLNDQFGHLAGDEVLARLAGAISSCIRREQLFARYGGEEFCLVLPELEPPQVDGLCEAVRVAVERAKFIFEEGTVQVTLSLGAAAFESGMSRSQLLEAADAQLYLAKKRGRNRVASTWNEPGADPK